MSSVRARFVKCLKYGEFGSKKGQPLLILNDKLVPLESTQEDFNWLPETINFSIFANQERIFQFDCE